MSIKTQLDASFRELPSRVNRLSIHTYTLYVTVWLPFISAHIVALYTLQMASLSDQVGLLGLASSITNFILSGGYSVSQTRLDRL